MFAALVCLATLAAANGANDVSRACATLLGGRVSTYARAMRWTVMFTLAGSLLSGLLAAGVARRFAAVLGSDPRHLVLAVPAVLVGASAWIWFSTWRRLPVATTHALVGCLLGVTWAAGGWAACARIDLAKGFVLPLLASPVLSCVGAVVLSWIVRLMPMPRISLLERVHWLSAGLTAFSRGINDSAKIWAILLPLSAMVAVGPANFERLIQVTVALAMLGGSVLAGRRVTETLGFGIVPISGVEGSTANVVTATIIISASLLGFPVASSHVVSGAIFGVGVAGHQHLLRWRSLATIVGAWLLTLPAAALLAVGLYNLFAWLGRLSNGSAWVGGVAVLVAATLMIRRRIGRGQREQASATPLTMRLIVFVCNSNTSRSPMAAQICAALLARIQLHEQVTVISRGITATEGEPLSASAGHALQRVGVSAAEHRAHNLDEQTAAKADLIVCMTEDQAQQLCAKFPACSAKVIRLDPERDIPNPAGKAPEIFERVAAHLAIALDARLNVLLGALAEHPA